MALHLNDTGGDVAKLLSRKEVLKMAPGMPTGSFAHAVKKSRVSPADYLLRGALHIPLYTPDSAALIVAAWGGGRKKKRGNNAS
jgi:hypothetical protein